MKSSPALCFLLTLVLLGTEPHACRAQAAAGPPDSVPKTFPIVPGTVGDFPAFTDVPKNHWAYESVQALHRMGILRGEPAAARAVNAKAHAKEGAVKRAKT